MGMSMDIFDCSVVIVWSGYTGYVVSAADF